MDPNATLERLRQAWTDRDEAEIRNASSDLLMWIRRGGFLPDVTEPQLSALLWMAAGFTFADATALILEADARS